MAFFVAGWTPYQQLVSAAAVVDTQSLLLVQADAPYRMTPEDVLALRIPNAEGELVPFSTFAYTNSGFWLTIVATSCVAAKATVSSMLMKDSKKTGMTPLVVLFYDSMFSSLFLGTACLFAGETIRLGQYAPPEPAVVGLGMIVGSCLAFPYNFITYKFIQLTSAMGWAIATSFKLFMAYPGVLYVDDGTLYRAFRQAGENGTRISMHAENGIVIDEIIREAVNDGKVEPKWHALTRPTRMEAEGVYRSIAIAEVADVPLYIVHLSCSDALEEVKRARARGLALRSTSKLRSWHAGALAGPSHLF